VNSVGARETAVFVMAREYAQSVMAKAYWNANPAGEGGTTSIEEENCHLPILGELFF
jgi:hypothetical protein